MTARALDLNTMMDYVGAGEEGRSGRGEEEGSEVAGWGVRNSGGEGEEMVSMYHVLQLRPKSLRSCSG